jgi:hypothetical protein
MKSRGCSDERLKAHPDRVAWKATCTTAFVESALGARRSCLVSVMLHMQLGGFARVMHRLLVMPAGGMRVVRGRLVIAAIMMLRGFAMVTGGVLVMFRCLVMMLGCLLRHIDLQLRRYCLAQRRC